MHLILTATDGVTISQSTLVAIVVALLGFIGTLVTLLHRDITGKIKDVHGDLKPLTITVAVHADKIKSQGEAHRELSGKHEELVDKHHNLAGKVTKNTERITELEHKVEKLIL